MILLQEVHSQSPTDEATLQAMVICYRELHRLDLIADMYAKAHKVKPDSEDILTALFMAYVRLGAYKKQQQTAMALHRLKPAKNPYYFWAVMSVFMQAISDEKLGPTMLLPLAERMTQKYVDDNKIDAEAEVKMYLIILEEMQKYDVALEVISGPLGEKLNSDVNFLKTESARLLSKLKRWPEANAAYRKLLQQEPDQWSFYKEYFRSLFRLKESNWRPEENSVLEDPVDYTLEKAVAFLEILVTQSQSAERPMRGPYLAQLELVHQLENMNLPKEDKEILGNPVDLFVQYYKRFGDRYCCFTDLRTYLTLLDMKQKDQLLKQLEVECPPALDSRDESVTSTQGAKALQRHNTVVQLSRHLGQHRKLDHEQRVEIIQDLMLRYRSGLNFGKTLTSTEFQYSDPYICIVAHLLYEGWKEIGDWSLLWQAILITEMALSNSQYNFQLKLLLIRLYGTIGAFGPCTDLYDSLEIKHIQNDALGYVIANHVGRLGHFNSAGMLYDNMLRFFTQNHKDTTEHLISSYKYGSFTQVREFIKFRERLHNSMQYASATAERLLLDMTLETSNHSRTEDILTYMDIDPEKDRTVWPDLRDNRDLFMMPSWDPPTSTSVEELHKKSFGEEYPLAGPFRTRLTTFLSLGVSQLFLDAIKCVLYIQSLHDLGQDKTDEEKEELMKSKITERLSDLISKQRGPLIVLNENKVMFYPDRLENLVHLTETIGFLTLLTGVCHQLLKPMKMGRRSRKKKDQAVAKDIDQLQADTWKKVWKSYEASFKNIETYLNQKKKYLTTFSL
ncbi:hypothetical protein LSH36_214g03025 [Paralvinella palmiformis]|uniref:N-alpha-acetyltransferase 25, NatB auxiliary subunit n=1 Tax=Paralvinella palmiformis TaxID=53620 RepID=A0AAD9JNP7_9ANNE|nr:hypothetical protein LSH36_214g03025 [Paralvinella palmiformis]